MCFRFFDAYSRFDTAHKSVASETGIALAPVDFAPLEHFVEFPDDHSAAHALVSFHYLARPGPVEFHPLKSIQHHFAHHRVFRAENRLNVVEAVHEYPSTPLSKYTISISSNISRCRSASSFSRAL